MQPWLPAPSSLLTQGPTWSDIEMPFSFRFFQMLTNMHPALDYGCYSKNGLSPIADMSPAACSQIEMMLFFIPQVS